MAVNAGNSRRRIRRHLFLMVIVLAMAIIGRVIPLIRLMILGHPAIAVHAILAIRLAILRFLVVPSH
ncbi:hypothetical protein N7470_004751 [Penicillium chermesinum]|nr:hypothetical protein N7470_004751 [Penicillium chermesinum]